MAGGDHANLHMAESCGWKLFTRHGDFVGYLLREGEVCIYMYVCTQSMYVYLLIRIQGGGGQRRLSAACSSLPLRFIRRIYREAGRLDSSFYEPIPSWDKQNGPILKVFFVSRERERKRERDMENGKTWRSV